MVWSGVWGQLVSLFLREENRRIQSALSGPWTLVQKTCVAESRGLSYITIQ